MAAALDFATRSAWVVRNRPCGSIGKGEADIAKGRASTYA